ncbi:MULTISPECIES: super-infection exclusion protein B [Staphylococcus]|uniref:super-infection exclusion protein B n=1 Tax=Staphylococcus epidermidis TaxID=1282 RepID=UPI00330B3EC9|nr:superinfection exclusion B family protein [Staphylococcus aureus]HDG2662635.1 superinfection exclusion B family protein [Staphylococcus aureus]
MEGIGKILDFISKPISFTILFALFLTTLLLTSINFLPSKYLEKIHATKFLSDYGSIIFVLMVISFFILIIQLISLVIKKIDDIRMKRAFRKMQNDFFKDEESLEILEKLYKNHPEAVFLSYTNQKVKLLNQYGLITPAVSKWYSRASQLTMPYILQPVAEEKMKQKHKKTSTNK